MSSREQRASWWLEQAGRNIEHAQERLSTLESERHKTRGTLAYAYDLLWNEVPAVVNVASGRLLRTVQAVIRLTEEDVHTISPDELREVLAKHLLGEDLWEEDQ